MTGMAHRLKPCLAAFLLLALAGCWTERVTWSPDGRQGLFIGPGGLYLSDRTGSLTFVPGDNLERAVWLGVSQRLLVVRHSRIDTFGALEGALGSERASVLAAKGEAIWGQLKAGVDRDLIQTDVDIFGPEGDAVELYLLDRHRDELAALFGEKDNEEEPAIFLRSLVVARVAGNRLDISATLYQDLSDIVAIRPAPDGTLVAFVTQARSLLGVSGPMTLFVVPADGSLSPAMIAQGVARDVDWTADGRSVVYLSGSAPKDRYILGSLEQVEITVAGGQLSSTARHLADVVFTDNARVRSLADGRLVFNATESRFPSTATDPAVEEVFALDCRGTEPSLTRLLPPEQRRQLPDSLSLFEISPDARQVLVPGSKSEMFLVSFRDGTVERIDAGLENDGSHHIPTPAWRAPGEFSYMKMLHGRPELVLRRNGTEIVLSRSWPDEVVLLLVR